MSPHTSFYKMASMLLGALILLQVYAVTAVPLISSEDEDIINSNQAPMKEPATSSFLRLFSETIAAVPVAVFFAENTENVLMRPSSREPRKDRRIDDRPKGFMIFELADGRYEGIGPFVEFSAEDDGSSDKNLPTLGLLPSQDDPFNSWFMQSKPSDPVIISEIVFNNSQQSSDDGKDLPLEFWVYENDDQVAAETANDNRGFIAMDYLVPVGTLGSTGMTNEESAILIAETNDKQAPLVLEEEILLKPPGDQPPTMMPLEENVLVIRWSDDKILLPDIRSLKEEQEITISVPVKQS